MQATLAIPSPHPSYGCSYIACGAGATTTAKASAGTLYGLWITGTGTTGTVAVEDTGTVYMTFTIPATAGVFSPPIPPQGIKHTTGIKITTSGTGITAAALYA